MRVQDSGKWIIDDEQRMLWLWIFDEITPNAFRRFAGSRSTADVLRLDQ